MEFQWFQISLGNFGLSSRRPIRKWTHSTSIEQHVHSLDNCVSARPFSILRAGRKGFGEGRWRQGEGGSAFIDDFSATFTVVPLLQSAYRKSLTIRIVAIPYKAVVITMMWLEEGKQTDLPYVRRRDPHRRLRLMVGSSRTGSPRRHCVSACCEMPRENCLDRSPIDSTKPPVRHPCFSSRTHSRHSRRSC